MSLSRDALLKIKVANCLEVGEAFEKSGQTEAASEKLCEAARVLFEDLREPNRAKKCLLRAKGLDPKAIEANLLLSQYFPDTLSVSRPPIVVDAFLHFPDEGDGGRPCQIDQPPPSGRGESTLND